MVTAEAASGTSGFANEVVAGLVGMPFFPSHIKEMQRFLGGASTIGAFGETLTTSGRCVDSFTSTLDRVCGVAIGFELNV